MTNDPWIPVYRARDALEAHVVASALENAGIEVRTKPADRSGFGAALPTLDAGPAVWVRSTSAEDARALIDDAKKGEAGRLSLADTPEGALGLMHDEDD